MLTLMFKQEIDPDRTPELCCLHWSHLDVNRTGKLGPLLPVILVKWVLDGLDWRQRTMGCGQVSSGYGPVGPGTGSYQGSP